LRRIGSNLPLFVAALFYGNDPATFGGFPKYSQDVDRICSNLTDQTSFILICLASNLMKLGKDSIAFGDGRISTPWQKKNAGLLGISLPLHRARKLISVAVRL
jgi:hypothetical protein